MALKILDMRFEDQDLGGRAKHKAGLIPYQAVLLALQDGLGPDGSWRVPSLDEMKLISTLAELGVGGFRSTYYWTSTGDKSPDDRGLYILHPAKKTPLMDRGTSLGFPIRPVHKTPGV